MTDGQKFRIRQTHRQIKKQTNGKTDRKTGEDKTNRVKTLSKTNRL